MRREKSGSLLVKAGNAWWCDLPLRVAAFAPRIATTLTDGLYLLRSTALALAAPAAALLFGAFYGWMHAGPTFTRSIVVLAILLGIGLMSINLGWCAWLGYILGDTFLSNQGVNSFGSYGLVENAVRQAGSTTISYLVLAILVVGIPTIGLSLRLSLATILERFPAAPVIAPLLAGASCAYLAYAWAQVSAALIRPVFTWLGSQPDTEDIFALQDRGLALAIGALIFMFLRAVAEPRLTNDHVRRAAQRLLVQLPLAIARGRARRNALGPVVTSVIAAGIFTLLLSGVIASIFEALLVWLVFIGLFLLRTAIGRTPGWKLVARVPSIIRVLIALAISYPLMSSYLESNYGSTSSLRPVLLTALIGISLAVLASATPEQKPETRLLKEAHA